MSIRVIFAVIFALLAGIGGTAAYFYFDRLDNAMVAPPAPPVKTEAPPSAPAKSDKPVTPAPPAPLASNATANGSLTDADLKIGEAFIGASIEDIKRTHGEAYAVEQKNKWHGGMKASVYEYPSFYDLYVVDGVVRAIKVEHVSGITTNKNIGIGSSYNDVIKAYGEPNRKERDHLVYFVKNNPSHALEFEMDHGLVEEIRAGLIK